MSLILQRYARFGNGLKCHMTFSRQIKVRRFLSFSRLQLRNQPNKEVAPSAEKVEGQLQTSFAKKAEENVKTASYSYSVVVLACFTLWFYIVGKVLFVFGKVLFAGGAPQDFFQYGSDKCMNHEKVQDLLGEPISAYGDVNRWSRRYRPHKSKEVELGNAWAMPKDVYYYTDESGKKGLRIQFDLTGLRRQAVVELDAREDDSGKLQTRYIIVTTTDMNRKSVIVEDNR